MAHDIPLGDQAHTTVALGQNWWKSSRLRRATWFTDLPSHIDPFILPSRSAFRLTYMVLAQQGEVGRALAQHVMEFGYAVLQSEGSPHPDLLVLAHDGELHLHELLMDNLLSLPLPDLAQPSLLDQGLIREETFSRLLVESLLLFSDKDEAEKHHQPLQPPLQGLSTLASIDRITRTLPFFLDETLLWNDGKPSFQMRMI